MTRVQNPGTPVTVTAGTPHTSKHPRWHGFQDALFRDVPYVLDSVWRNAEFRANRAGELALTPDAREFKIRAATCSAVAFARSPVFVQFAFVAVFYCFGPTFDTFCTLLREDFYATVGRGLFGLAVAVASIRALSGLFSTGRYVLAQRFASGAQTTSSHLELAYRRATTYVLCIAAAVVLFAIPGFLVAYQFPLLNESPVCKVTPHWPAALLQVIVTSLALVTGLFILRQDKVSSTRQFRGLVVLFIVTGIVLWLLIPALTNSALTDAFQHPWMMLLSGVEANDGPYATTFAALVLVMLGVIAFAHFLARRILAGWSKTLIPRFRRQLAAVELLNNRRPDPHFREPFRRLAALVNGLWYHPLHFLLLPALGALLSPTRGMWFATLGGAVISLFVIMWGSLSPRWQELVTFIGRWFISGTPLLVSIAVIVLAFLRLSGVQYVSTVVDAAPFGFIFILILMSYSLLWFGEYWINRWAGEALLRILGDPDVSGTYVKAKPLAFDQAIPKRGEIVALHGTGRFAVHGWYWRDFGSERDQRKDAQVAFTTYSFGELFEALGRKINVDLTVEVARRLRLYFVLVNLTMVALLLLFLYVRLFWNTPIKQTSAVTAVYAAPETAVTPTIDLADLIVQQARKSRPALAIAASGGGTRAAVYAATALEGLSRLHLTDDIILLSGVSGGGVAVTYYASHTQALGAQASEDDWSGFKQKMADPFIQDVLDGSLELRMAGTEVLGKLLQESFKRRLFTGPASTNIVDTIGEIGRLGLIVNTTVSGHPRQVSTLLNNRIGYAEDEDCVELARPFSSRAGSRLIFTNLSNANAFPDEKSTVPDAQFLYRVVRDPDVQLASAAALTANFPPVFPNARVTLQTSEIKECSEVSFYVTDGGAAENLGLISALYALKEAIPRAKQILAGTAWTLPEIHVVVIEASAVTYDYEQDRGVAAAMDGGKTQLAGGLTQALIDDVNSVMQCRGCSLNVHYLPLPIPFRSRGGFGTHWMFAKSIRVSNPLIPEPRGRWAQFWRQNITGERQFEILRQEKVTEIWDDLFDDRGGFCDGSPPEDIDNSRERVAQWVCGRDPPSPRTHQPDLQVEQWDELIRQLSPTQVSSGN
jgi:Patatin-like phospholipase